MQAYGVKNTVLFEADGAEEDSSPLFSALFLLGLRSLAASRLSPIVSNASSIQLRMPSKPLPLLLARETEEQREADWQQLIREVENFGGGHSNSPRSSFTDPWVEESKEEAEEEAVVPLNVKPSWHLVP